MNKPRLTDQDFQWAAQALGVDVATVKAVTEVESSGAGFLPTGEPLILFERHLFHKFTRGRFDQVAPDLSHPARGGYGKAGQHQHARLQRAVALDREAALRSTSWGLFQVMGYNHAVAGFPTLQGFVTAMYRGEREHLAAFVGFVKTERLEGLLRRRDWAGFARRYNGATYAANRYHIKLAQAYERFQGVS